MKVRFNYSVRLGKYDSNDDVFEWEVSSSDPDVEKAYRMAVMTGEEFEDVPEMQELLKQAYREIEDKELKKLREDKEDAFALDCFKQGKNPFECGYKLSVFFGDEEIIPEDEDIEACLVEALSAHNTELAEAIILEHYENYSGNLVEKAFELAEAAGCTEFIERNRRD